MRHCLHCLSAFTAFPTLGWSATSCPSALSPLPFGIHRVPDYKKSCQQDRTILRLHCLSAFTAFPTRGQGDNPGRGRSPLPFGIHRVPDKEFLRRCRLAAAASLHCLSAFTAFPTPRCHHGGGRVPGSLHCLSAFTAFPTQGGGGQSQGRGRVSPLPFGIHRVPDQRPTPNSLQTIVGLHCLSAFTAFPTTPNDRGIPVRARSVSIAFRHSPRSRRGGQGKG